MDPTAIISQHSRIRYPEHFVVGAHSIVDDHCYLSTRIEIGRGSHVAANCTIAGGKKWRFSLGDYSSLASGVRVYCSSNDYVNDLVMILPEGMTDRGISGDVTVGNYTGVGANSVVLPDNTIPEGTVIGALSLVPPRFAFEPWSVYAGNPLRLIKPRNRAAVLEQVRLVNERLKR